LDISPEKIQEIMADLKPEARIIFEKLLLSVASVEPLEEIKNWISKFESDCPVDNLIARLSAQIINNVGRNIWDDMREREKSGNKQYSGHEAAVIAVREVRRVADLLEQHLSHEHCKDCSTTH